MPLRIGLVLPLVIFLGLQAAGTLAAESPFDNSGLLRSLTESPTVAFESEEAEETLAEDLRSSDIVFTGKIRDISLSRMGIGGPSIPVARIFFQDIEILKGTLPRSQDNFLSRHSPDYLQQYGSVRLLVMLKKAEDRSQTLFVRQLMRAPARIYKIAKEILQPPSADSACSETEETACSEELLEVPLPGG